MMETYIADLHTSFCITSIKKLAFYLPHIRITGNNNCGKTRRELFKRCSANQDVLYHCDYSERVVDDLAHKIQSEYYGGNRSVYIKGIGLDNSIAPTQTETAGTPQSHTCHAVSSLVLSDDSKQDTATTISHSKHTIESLKQRNIVSNMLSTIW